MNNKILSFVLVIGIASTWFAGISAANSGNTLSNAKGNIEKWIKNFSQDGKQLWKRKGFKNLSEDEKLALESMSNDEKKAFFQSKKVEKKAQKKAVKAVIDKLLNGESLTAAEEALRGEMLMKIEEGKHKRNNADIIAKVLAGDALTDSELVEITEMKEKHAQREAQRAILKPIRDKVDAGEELTDEEQTILDNHKANKPEGKKGKKGGKGQRGENR